MKRLFRSRTNAVLGGVCGGLAEYFKVDPILFRIGCVVLTLLFLWWAPLIYIICWIFIPRSEFQGASEGDE